jgi:hypothetical protein
MQAVLPAGQNINLIGGRSSKSAVSVLLQSGDLESLFNYAPLMHAASRSRRCRNCATSPPTCNCKNPQMTVEIDREKRRESTASPSTRSATSSTTPIGSRQIGDDLHAVERLPDDPGGQRAYQQLIPAVLSRCCSRPPMARTYRSRRWRRSSRAVGPAADQPHLGSSRR